MPLRAAAFHGLPHRDQRVLLLVESRLGSCALGFKLHCLFAFLFDGEVPGLARVLVALRLRHPVLQPSLDALRLVLHLLQRRALVGRFALGLPALFAARFKPRAQFFDLASQRRCFELRLSKIVLQSREANLRLAQFTLQHERAGARRLAARHRRVVGSILLLV